MRKCEESSAGKEHPYQPIVEVPEIDAGNSGLRRSQPAEHQEQEDLVRDDGESTPPGISSMHWVIFNHTQV